MRLGAGWPVLLLVLAWCVGQGGAFSAGKLGTSGGLLPRSAVQCRPLVASPRAVPSSGENAGPSEGVATPASGPLARVRAFFKGKFTKDNMAALGLSVVLSYGWVSNVNSAAMIAWVWALYVKDTGVSPFLGWQPPFLTTKFFAFYAIFYASIGTLLRPVRATIAIAIGPYFDRILKFLQEKLRVPRAVAVLTLVFLANVVFTFAWLFLNLRIASWVLQVPINPPAVPAP
mmetsp:Transcript_23110/g.67336  ORF Transcript_23110/g.67336 Transcript_23110/m.67336 type:complete len:230 (-) Transcript_23110:196-885(-)